MSVSISMLRASAFGEEPNGGVCEVVLRTGAGAGSEDRTIPFLAETVTGLG